MDQYLHVADCSRIVPGASDLGMKIEARSSPPDPTRLFEKNVDLIA